MRKGHRLLAMITLGTLVLGAAGDAQSKPSTDHTLIIGSISRSIKEEIETFQPLADYLKPRLGAVGIGDVNIAVVTNPGEMARRLASGEIDIYVDSPFIIARISREAGAKPFLRRWKKGVAEYHTLFVTQKDSGIESLDDLLGNVIAFDDPQSSSGHLLPKAMLLQRGYKLVELRTPSDPVPPDAIGYVFSMDDVNTMFWLDHGKVAAGVTSPEFLKLYQKKNKDRIVSFARSFDIPRHVVAHRQGLHPAVLAELERVLTGMEHNGAGRNALRAFQRTTRFDHFPAGVEATFAPIYGMLEALDSTDPGLIN